MSEDEAAIRALMDRWMSATEQGDMVTILGLMSDDVVFTVPGMPPFGKAGFSAGFMAMQAFEVRASCEPAEIAVMGDWAYIRNHIRVSMTPRLGGEGKTKRAGYTMSILKKRPNGSWVVTRDANMLTPEP